MVENWQRAGLDQTSELLIFNWFWNNIKFMLNLNLLPTPTLFLSTTFLLLTKQFLLAGVSSFCGPVCLNSTTEGPRHVSFIDSGVPWDMLTLVIQQQTSCTSIRVCPEQAVSVLLSFIKLRGFADPQPGHFKQASWWCCQNWTWQVFFNLSGVSLVFRIIPDSCCSKNYAATQATA